MVLVLALAAAAATGWVYERKVDQFTDAVSHSASVNSKSGNMIIEFACGAGTKPTYSFIANKSFGGEYIGGDGIKRIMIDVRAGARPARSMKVLGLRGVAPSYSGQGPDYDNIDREMTSGEASMIVRAQMIGDSFVTESFDMKGAVAAIAKAKVGCGLS